MAENVKYKVTTTKYSLFRDATQRRLLVTYVSGQPIGPIFNCEAVQAILLRCQRCYLCIAE